MKALYLFLLVIMCSCNQGSRHPQADLINQTTSTAMTSQSILNFADSIDERISSIEKHTSLVYQLGDASMYVERYSLNGAPAMYAKYVNDEAIGNGIKKYYFKNDSLILIKAGKTTVEQKGETVEEERVFLRNNIAFKKENRVASSLPSLKTKPFLNEALTEENTEDFADSVSLLNDAVNGRNKFEMVFDQIISSPGDRHILLKSKMPNGYSASVVVNSHDRLTDSIFSDPSVFKDRKLNMKWEVRGKEAVYVPVAADVTSAKGLKR